jgi:hypothetical protein
MRLIDGEPEMTTLDDLRRQGIGVSERTSRDSLARHDVYRVVEQPKPAALPGHKVALADAPVQAGGRWVIGSQQVPIAAEDRPHLTVERGAFALAAHRAHLITADEARAWAGGTALPAAIADVFAVAIPDPDDRLAAELEALTTQTIRRGNRLVQMLQGAFALTDAQADALFPQ